MTDLLVRPHRLDVENLACRATVETPCGRGSEFDHDPESGLFELAGVLPAGMALLLSFGFIPRTKTAGGDPVDILMLADEEMRVGCPSRVRLLDVIEAEQTERARPAATFASLRSSPSRTPVALSKASRP